MFGDEVPVLLSGAPLVEGAVAAAARARGGASLAEVATEARGALRAKDVPGDEEDDRRPRRPRPSRGDALRARVTIALPHGLHVRPAAQVVAAATRHDARVEVRNASRGKGPADAASLTALAMLHARQGDELEFAVSGPAAAGGRSTTCSRWRRTTSARTSRPRRRWPSRRDMPAAVDAAPPARRDVAGRGGVAGRRDRAGALARWRAGGRRGGRRGRARAARRRPRRGPRRARRDRARTSLPPADRRRGHLRRAPDVARRLGADRARGQRDRRRRLGGRGVPGRGQGDRRRVPGARRSVPQAARRRRRGRGAARAAAARRRGQRAPRAGDRRGGRAHARRCRAARPEDRPTRSWPRAAGRTDHASIIAGGLGIPVVVGVGPALLRVEEGATIGVDGDTVELEPDVAALHPQARRGGRNSANRRSPTPSAR